MRGRQPVSLEQVPSRTRGTPLSRDEKWMVVRVFHQCNEERRHQDSIATRDAHSRTSQYMGIGRRQVVRIIEHFKETGDVPPATPPGNRSVHPTTIPSLAESQIRQFIFTRHLRGEICNANHVQDFLGDLLKRDVPKRTIRAHLTRMGFTYSRTKKKSRSLREKPYVRQQRHSYLHAIAHLRQLGYQPIYLDESFLHHYHGNQFSWFHDEYGDYLERPTGKGRRWCFIHAISPYGLVKNALRIFEAKRSTGDYHNMFNAQHFQEWWTEQLLPNLPPRCVIVIDRASFHLVPSEQIIPQALRKAELREWLTHKNIPWKNHWLKARLVEEVNNNHDKTPMVQTLAEAHGHKFLLLPVHHPELNPIELIWAIVKNECGRLLRQGVKFPEVREHLQAAFHNITAATCDKLYQKIQRQEESYWTTDMELDDVDDVQEIREDSETIQRSEEPC
jgi:hypothetical protein